MLNDLKERFGSHSSVKSGKLTMQFVGKNEQPTETPSQNTFTIWVHACPDDFSTVDYYDVRCTLNIRNAVVLIEHIPCPQTLKTDHIGRLLVYAPVMSSTMDAVNNLSIHHGLAFVARQQTHSVGRSNNQVQIHANFHSVNQHQ